MIPNVHRKAHEKVAIVVLLVATVATAYLASPGVAGFLWALAVWIELHATRRALLTTRVERDLATDCVVKLRRGPESLRETEHGE